MRRALHSPLRADQDSTNKVLETPTGGNGGNAFSDGPLGLRTRPSDTFVTGKRVAPSAVFGKRFRTGLRWLENRFEMFLRSPQRSAISFFGLGRDEDRFLRRSFQERVQPERGIGDARFGVLTNRRNSRYSNLFRR